MVEHDYFFKLLTNLVKAAMHVIYLEENAMLRRRQHDSRSMLVESDRVLPNVVDRRILILRDKLDEEKKIVKNLKREVILNIFYLLTCQKPLT